MRCDEGGKSKADTSVGGRAGTPLEALKWLYSSNKNKIDELNMVDLFRGVSESASTFVSLDS